MVTTSSLPSAKGKGAVKIANSIEIKAAPERVFYWLEEPDRAAQWMTSVTRSEIIEETPNRIGTTFREYIEEEGRGIEMHRVITKFVSNKRFGVHLESKLNSVDVDFELLEKDGTTRLVQNVELQFKGMLKVLSVFLHASVKRKIMSQARSEFARLKELCEKIP